MEGGMKRVDEVDEVDKVDGALKRDEVRMVVWRLDGYLESGKSERQAMAPAPHALWRRGKKSALKRA